MSYVSLYRKWRPRTFDQVRGQDAVVTTLKNQIKNDRAGHAYIFIGTRGTGKTSVARIMAASLNCEDLRDGNPCCECPSCKRILSGEAMNVREIDAASNTGVDSARELKEDVLYPPADGRKKVYIIDEVHMLSTSAFNALLKTLEEPPEYVTFIMATTETAKIPMTIFSRCQRYDFHRISVADIETQIKMLAGQEGLEIEDKACNYIAKKADGAMRDALSLLDRCAAYSLGEKITYDKVLSAIGAVDLESFSRMFKCLVNTDTVGCIKVLDEVISQGRVLSTFITDLIGYMRNLLLLSSSADQDISDILESTEENMAVMKEDAALTDAATLSMYIRALSGLLQDMKNTNQQRTIAEAAFIKLTRPAIRADEPDAAAQKRIQALEKKLGEVMGELEKVKEGAVSISDNTRSLSNGTLSPSDGTRSLSENADDIPQSEAEPSAATQSRVCTGNPSTGNPYLEISDCMKMIAERWSLILEEFERPPTLLDYVLQKCKLALKDGQTLEIVVESQACYDNLLKDSGKGTGRSNIEELRKHISDMSGGMDVRLEAAVIEKGELSNVRGLDEMVHMTIQHDERKDDV